MTMDIGIPKEIKDHEGRVALLPDACEQLINAGHRVFIQAGAGQLSGYPDEDYLRVGVVVIPDAAGLYAAAKLVVKVKEPVPDEFQYLRADHTLFCYLHLAAEPELTAFLCECGLTAVAFETVVTDQEQLPLLAPMSAIAGRVAVQVGTHLLHLPSGGHGVLLGGIGTTEPGRVVILGAGVAGSHAATLAAAIGADVTVFDKLPERLQVISGNAPNIRGELSEPDAVAASVAEADLVVGAVLIPGARAPKVVTAEMVKAMRAGSVIADVSVDQGGCIETTRPTSYRAPTYTVDEVIHFTVTNMPGAVPRTASQALSLAVCPYVLRLAGPEGITGDSALSRGINISNGTIVHPALRPD